MTSADANSQSYRERKEEEEIFLLRPEQYTVGWICALPTELAAAKAMLDANHAPLESQPVHDDNHYDLGSIGKHNIVITCLPAYGNVTTAIAVTSMQNTFPSLRFGLLVGVGGGIPSGTNDIRLGDVVVSLPEGQGGGVIKYDMGRQEVEGFERVGMLNKPPRPLLAVIPTLRSTRTLGKEIAALVNQKFADDEDADEWTYPYAAKDILFKANYKHVDKSPTCDACASNSASFVYRNRRRTTNPKIYYGNIGSGDSVMKDGELRDQLAARDNIICFEMEAAGLMDKFPCLVIRGISDYADSHKNRNWQPYSAAVAAAYAKKLLTVIRPTEVTKMPTVNEVLRTLSAELAANTAIAQRVEEHVSTAEERIILDWLSSSDFSAPQNSAQKSRTLGTGEWLIRQSEYTNWRDNSAGLLWLHGVSGCGKSFLCCTAINDLQQLCKLDPRKRIAYWYFQFSDVNTQNICNMLQSILRQLSLLPLDTSIRHLWDQHQKSGSKPSIKELMETIRNIINGLKQDVFIAIDALDECPLPERNELLESIEELRNSNSGDTKLHILVTSRREPDIDAKLNQKSTVAIDIENLVKSDIRLFIEAALLKNERLRRWDDDSKMRILGRLTAVGETRFRWADLQIKRLQSCRNKVELIDALTTTPESLEKTYEEALEKIPTEDEKHVRKILMWITTSLRPMKLDEIAAVVSFQFPADILELCTSLLVTLIDENAGPTIKLAHFSVKEYLITVRHANEVFPWYRFQNGQAHNLISEMAITYLLDPDYLNGSEGNGVPGSLLKYSAQYWPQHAVEAFQSDSDDAKRLQAQINLLFSSDNSQRYIAWIQTYDHDREPYNYNREWFYEGTRTRYPQPLYYASLLGFRMTVEMLLEKGCQINTNEGQTGNALNAGAIYGNFQIVEYFLSHEKMARIADLPQIARKIKRNVEKTFGLFLTKEVRADVVITEEVVMAAVGNRENGKEVMALLLGRRGADVVITEEVVKAAASNWGNGKEVMTLLLEHRGADVVITEEVIKAAAGNPVDAREVTALLLERRGAEMVMTEEVVKAAAGNDENGKEVMALLLEWRGTDVVITEEVVKTAAGNYGNGKEVMALLLERRGADVVITEEVVIAAAGNYGNGKDVMALLLEHRGADVAITEEVVKASASNLGNGKEVMTLLLKHRGVDVVITEQVVNAAAGNAEYGNEVMILLLEQRGADMVITEDMVKVLAGFGKEVMTLLLERRGADLVITEEVVKIVAGRFGKEMMTLLLELRGSDVVITEEVVIAAAGNYGNGKEVMALLLEHQGADVVITEEVVKASASNLGNGKEVMTLLLKHRGADVVITEEVVKAAAGNWKNGKEVMILLLEQRGVEMVIIEDVVKAAASTFGFTEEVMTLLLEQRRGESLAEEYRIKV